MPDLINNVKDMSPEIKRHLEKKYFNYDLVKNK